MKVWVTGSSGMLGKAVVKALLARRIKVAASTRQEADVTSLPSLLRYSEIHGPFTHIVHCAAYTKVDLAETNPDEARRANSLSMALLGLLSAEKRCRLIALSTDYVFDGNKKNPYVETDPVAPANVYGKTKAEGEERLLSIFPTACIIRTSWLFGEGGKNFVSTMSDLMKSREEVRVVGDQRGRPTYATDLAHWIVEMLDESGIYHLANEGEASWFEFATVIQQELSRQNKPLACKKIVSVTSAEFGALAKRPLYSVLGTAKVEKKFSLRPWQEGMKEYLHETH